MRTVFSLFILIFLISSQNVFGQKNFEKKKERNDPQEAIFLNQAKNLRMKAPEKAIEKVKDAIAIAEKSGNNLVLGESYYLLGLIYEDIDEADQAIERYKQSLLILKKTKGSNRLLGEISNDLGHLLLDKGLYKEAETNFQFAIKVSKDAVVLNSSNIGLAENFAVTQQSTNFSNSIKILEKNGANDSLDLARREALEVQYLIRNNQLEEALQAFQKSMNYIPNDASLGGKENAVIQRAKERILNYRELSNADRIAVQKNTISKISGPENNDIRLKEYLKIVELFEEDNNDEEAIEFLNAGKELITPETDKALAAEIYKNSHEVNKRTNNTTQAALDLEQYANFNEELKEDIQDNAQINLSIERGQRKIDLFSKDNKIQQQDAALLASQLRTQRILTALLGLGLLASIIFFYFLNKNVKAKRKANQLLYLKSLRTQMNPHFIFNALNSVNNFIAQNDEKAANKFLSDFSNLMRRVLDHSKKDFIPFEQEMELNELYLKLEHFRFRDRFDYHFENQIEDPYDTEIPPMLIQPFIENAVWHGLRYKEEKGHLKVSVEEKDDMLTVLVEDNGVGRTQSKMLKTENQKKFKSTGVENTQKRIDLINEIYQKNYSVEIEDLYPNKEETGTLVKINIPKK